VLVCRGGHCGDEKEHKDLDHEAQVRSLEGAAKDVGGRVVVTKCLDACGKSNVVVLKSGAEAVWLSRINREKHTLAVCDVISGRADVLPEKLAKRRFDPKRKQEKTADHELKRYVKAERKKD
jgi:hypothetical protein